MNSEAIKPWQAEKINKSVGPSLNYLGRLRHRMEKRGFPMSDPYYRTVCTAFDAMQAIFVQTHYLSCTSGVGKAGHNEEKRPCYATVRIIVFISTGACR